MMVSGLRQAPFDYEPDPLVHWHDFKVPSMMTDVT